MGFDNVCLQRRDLRGLAMHHCDTDSNAWFHRMLFELDLWQEPNAKKWDINSTMLGMFGPRRLAVQPAARARARAIISSSSQESLWPAFGENVSLSNTFDSTALNHSLTVFTLWSFLFYNSQLLLYKSGKGLQVRREQEGALAKLDFCFF